MPKYVMLLQVGFPLRYCHIQRPWETPYDLEELQQKGKIKPSKLAMGSAVDDYVMISDPGVRKCLHNLVFGVKGKTPACKYHISKEEGDVIKKWMQNNVRELIPFIPLVTKPVQTEGSHTDRVFLAESARGIIEVCCSFVIRRSHADAYNTVSPIQFCLLVQF